MDRGKKSQLFLVPCGLDRENIGSQSKDKPLQGEKLRRMGAGVVFWDWEETGFFSNSGSGLGWDGSEKPLLCHPLTFNFWMRVDFSKQSDYEQMQHNCVCADNGHEDKQHGD